MMLREVPQQIKREAQIWKSWLLRGSTKLIWVLPSCGL
ncbi:hypothetical protein MPTK1_Vg00460 [Marchantia polymorpha subsp. ruderalis]